MEIWRDRVVDIKSITDNRGVLSVVEGNRSIPFKIKRIFWISDVPKGETRGGHAHAKCRQAIFALKGSFWIKIEKVVSEKEPYAFAANLYGNQGLVVEPGEFVQLSGFSADAVCLVLCSEHYDSRDYIYIKNDTLTEKNTFFATCTAQTAETTARSRL